MGKNLCKNNYCQNEVERELFYDVYAERKINGKDFKKSVYNR